MKWYYGFEFGKPIYSNEKENIMYVSNSREMNIYTF
jgi:hypothetical protein